MTPAMKQWVKYFARRWEFALEIGCIEVRQIHRVYSSFQNQLLGTLEPRTQRPVSSAQQNFQVCRRPPATMHSWRNFPTPIVAKKGWTPGNYSCLTVPNFQCSWNRDGAKGASFWRNVCKAHLWSRTMARAWRDAHLIGSGKELAPKNARVNKHLSEGTCPVYIIHRLL